MSNYWKKRKGLKYYRIAHRMVECYAESHHSLIDVGSAQTEYILWYTDFQFKLQLDLRPLPNLQGINSWQMNFMEFPHKGFSVALCLQVLEHVEDPEAFAQKLFTIADLVVISVPWEWPAHVDASHKHDPVDEAKLMSWTHREPLEMELGKARLRHRMVAAYQGGV